MSSDRSIVTNRGCRAAWVCRYTLLVLVLGWVTARAAEGPSPYYRQLQSFLSTNGEAWEVRSPLFIDTNNTGFKLTNAIIRLADIKTTKALAGLRPGMTMTEVVATWGKPMELWVKGFGGPRFRYQEVNVFFDPRFDRVKSIYTHNLPALLRKLELTPKVTECLAALGDPGDREDSTTGGPGYIETQTRVEQRKTKGAPVMWTFLNYPLGETRFKIGFERGRLSTLQLEVAD